MTVSAMYPGTFDPITLGHEDLVRRASTLFERVVVAIADNPSTKAPMFTTDERVAMAAIALAGLRSTSPATMGCASSFVAYGPCRTSNMNFSLPT